MAAPPPLQLHVWGPGFGLPSFDAECLAAVAYLAFLFPRQDWVLIPSNNPTLSPSNKLPLLVDGAYFISGFSLIVDYLRKRPSIPASLDAHLPPIARAESKAFSALILSRAAPVLDFALFLDHDNYTSATRPLIASQLGFLERYTYPQRLRNAALARSGDHYAGMSTNDTSMTPVGAPRNSVIEAVDLSSTTTLMPGVKSATSMVRSTPEMKATFKLESLCDRFLTPLAEKLGENAFLIAEEEDRPSEADCLALAYLSLCLSPDLPNDTVQKLMREKYPRLCGWAHHLGERVFGAKIQPTDVLGLEETKIVGERGLQWGARETGDFLWLTKFVTNTVFGKGNAARQKALERLRQERDAAETPMQKQQRLAAEALRRSRRIWNFATVAVGVVGWVLYVSTMHFSASGHEEEQRHSGNGHEEEEQERGEQRQFEAPQVNGFFRQASSESSEMEEEEVGDDDDDIRSALFSQDDGEDDDY